MRIPEFKTAHLVPIQTRTAERQKPEANPRNLPTVAMSIVSRILGVASRDAVDPAPPARASDTLLDGAIDTLSSVIRVMGEESFELENDLAPVEFAALCREFASHVATCTPVPAAGIPACENGSRQWARVRQFYTERRKAEKSFVTERLSDYRGVVADLVSGLRSIGERDQSTETAVLESLHTIENAVGSGVLPEIRKALSITLQEVNETFTEQKRHYEEQLNELNKRMLGLRQDLVAAREEMQRDSLTGAYNRRAFDESILHSLNTRFILNQPATLALIDLDNFKRVNDDYGHSAGDDVLRLVGECLTRAFIRKGDFVSRYGGDEFAVILNDTTAANSRNLIERFLHYVRDLRVANIPGDVPIACSIGYTELQNSDCAKSVVARADQALYEAKRGGRNQAVLRVTDVDDAAR